MASIGGVSCHLVHEERYRALKERGSTWQVPGIDGYGAQLFGLGDSEFAFVGVVFGTNAAVETWAALIEALQYDVISVANDWADTRANLLVTRVGMLTKRARIDHDGNGMCRGEIRVEGVVVA